MKTLRYTFTGFLLAMSVAAAQSTVTLNSSFDRKYLADESGIRLPDGSLVLLGSFGNPEAIANLSIQQLQEDAQWRLFGDSEVISIVGEGGKIGGDVNYNGPDPDSFAGLQIFLWVFNAPSLYEATQYGIFTTPAWIFPSKMPDSGVISLNDASIARLGFLDASGAMRLVAIPVPEPATYAFGVALLSLAALAVRRRARAK